MIPLEVSVDQDACIGCGLCIGVCPEVFEFNENGRSSVRKSYTMGALVMKSSCGDSSEITNLIPAEIAYKYRLAIKGCPANAISER